MSIRRNADPDKRSDAVPTAALGIGAAALMVVCCAGPALVAGGALAAAGQFFASPFVLAAGLAVVLAALVLAFGRRHRGDRDCCPPVPQTPPGKIHDRDVPT